jgi:hypothetical protein
MIIGESYQIVEKGEAGSYAGSLKAYNYPDLIAGSTVLTAEVEVFLNTAEDEFDITGDSTITTSTVTVPGSLTPEKEVTANRKISLVDGSTHSTVSGEFFFIDANADFSSDQIRPGDILRFEQTPANLELSDTQVATTNTDDYIVISVVSRTQLQISKALADEDRLEYNLFRGGSAAGTVSISYRARRQDGVGVCFEARDLVEVEAALGTIAPENPLAFGMALALANTNQLVAGTMVALDSTDNWQEAADYIETKESAYAIVPLTTNPVAHQIFQKHVNFMSEPRQKGERIVFINPLNPTEEIYQTAKTDGSITANAGQGTSTFTSATSDFLTAEVPVGALVEISAGGPPLIGAQPVTTFQVASIDSATQLTVLGEVDAPVAALTFTVESGTFSKLDLARNAAARGQAYDDRRVFYVFPETVKTVVAESEVTVNSYFASAAIAGLVSGVNPSQGFTNFPLAGFTGVIGSTEFFSRQDQATIAGGGVWILEEPVAGGPISTRHQLSTDVSTIEFRELSITKAIDFVAKFFRLQLKDLIGVNVINTNFLQNILRPAAEAVVRDIIEDTVVGEGTRIVSIRQSTDQPDTVEVDVRVDVLYPANYIDVTLII